MRSMNEPELDQPRRFRGMLRMSLTAGAVLAALATGALALGLATGLVPSSIFGAARARRRRHSRLRRRRCGRWSVQLARRTRRAW